MYSFTYILIDRFRILRKFLTLKVSKSLVKIYVNAYIYIYFKRAEASGNIFFDIVLKCFAQHLPFIINPESIRYLLLSGLSMIINNNPEKYKKYFFNNDSSEKTTSEETYDQVRENIEALRTTCSNISIISRKINQLFELKIEIDEKIAKMNSF